MFREISTDEALNLIKEADSTNAFLPSVSDPEFSVVRFLSQEDFPGYRLFGINNDLGQIESFISIKPDENGTIIIGPMYVAELSRGKGLGKLQVQKLIDWAKNNNISAISTKTWGENKASRKIFEDLGFKLVGEKLKSRINGDSTVKYYKEI